MSTPGAPFPWFGGKSRVAPQVWERFGDLPNYVEPFAGSLAVLLGRPTPPKVETVNDLDGFVSNFWRAVAADPAGVAEHADWPVNENDKHARELHLVAHRAELTARLSGDPGFYDARIAGWWVWGLCVHIGGGFADGNGPWVEHEGRMVDGRQLEGADAGAGINRTMPHGGDGGQGINKAMPRTSPAGINRQMPHVGDAGRGINRQMPHVGNAGRGINKQVPTGHAGRRAFIEGWFQALAVRLRHVRVLSGDWTRCLSESLTTRHGVTGIFLDPPYGEEVEQTRVYVTDSGTVSDDVRAWCAENGDNPLLRIALCGYEGEGHEQLLEHGWTSHRWTAHGGYGSGKGGAGEANRHKERIFFSPHSAPAELGLFDQTGRGLL